MITDQYYYVSGARRCEVSMVVFNKEETKNYMYNAQVHGGSLT